MLTTTMLKGWCVAGVMCTIVYHVSMHTFAKHNSIILQFCRYLVISNWEIKMLYWSISSCFSLSGSHRSCISLRYSHTSSCLPCSSTMCSFLEQKMVSSTLWHLSGENCLKWRWDSFYEWGEGKESWLHIGIRWLKPTFSCLNQVHYFIGYYIYI